MAGGRTVLLGAILMLLDGSIVNFAWAAVVDLAATRMIFNLVRQN
jgi:hypothetical protein